MTGMTMRDHSHGLGGSCILLSVVQHFTPQGKCVESLQEQKRGESGCV